MFAWRVFHALETCCSVSWNFHQFQDTQITAKLNHAAKATKSLSYLGHSLLSATHSAKAAAYVSLVRPLPEYIHALYGTLILARISYFWNKCSSMGLWSRWSPTTRKWSKSSAYRILKMSSFFLLLFMLYCLGQPFLLVVITLYL